MLCKFVLAAIETFQFNLSMFVGMEIIADLYQYDHEISKSLRFLYRLLIIDSVQFYLINISSRNMKTNFERFLSLRL